MIRPRRLAWTGRVTARALWLDVDVLGEDEARRRVLGLWRPGCRLERSDGGWLLHLEGLRALSAPFPGTPLVPRDGVLLGAPLHPRERDALDAPAGSAWHVRGGRLVRLVPGEALDPSAWLDPGDLAPAPARRLGQAVDVARAALVDTGLRGKDFERYDIVGDGFAGRAAEVGADRTATARPLPAWGRWLARVLSWADDLLARLQPRAPTRPLDPAVPTPPRPPTWVDRLRRRLSGWLLGLLARGPLSWMARDEAAWLRDLLDAFDRGDLDEALRRAIPLGGGGVGGGLRGRLRRREGPLRPTPERGGAAAMLLSGADLHGTLQRLYEDAARRLEAEGRITEAAFVLADLLDRPAEAVHLLEAHGHLAEAADLAEGRRLDPALVIRLWVQAGDLDRAVLLARRHEAWAEALSALQDHAAHAVDDLRAAWARTRAAAGDLVGAFLTAWPAEGLRDEARPWLRAALDDPGPAGARALAAAWARHEDPDLLPRAAHLLAEHGVSGAVRRSALARALLADRTFARDAAPAERRPRDRRLAGRLGRALLADPPQTDTAHHRGLVDRLLGLSGDPALHHDRPRDPLPAVGQARTTWDADDRGGLPARDAAWLPDGRLVVACGEAGLRLLDPRGEVVGRLPVPAHHLVVSDDGDRLLALQRLDAALAVTRVDLRAGTVTPWARVALDDWADTFDGQRWCVAAEGELLVIDTLDDGWRHLWRVAPEGRLQALARAEGSLRGLVERGDGEVEVWRWDLPAVVLRARPTAVAAADRHGAGAPVFLGPEAVHVLPDDTVTVVGITPRTLVPPEDLPDARFTRLMLPRGRVDGGRALLAWIAVPLGHDLPALHLQHRLGGGRTTGPARRTDLRLDGARTLTVRPGPGGAWVVADDAGRIIALDELGRVVLDVRV